MDHGRGAFTPHALLRLDPDGIITLIVGRPEMGQAIRSGLPLIVAAEMDADWSRVRLEQVDLEEKYGDQYAGGSNSTQHDFARLRQAGAAARWLLLRAAANERKAPSGEHRSECGRVVHASGRSAGGLPGLPEMRDDRARLLQQAAQEANAQFGRR